MRLRQLNLVRYGHFTDFTIDLGKKREGGADFHIILGENEAGKSTAFNGYLDLLFGIEERSKYNFVHDYSLLRIGAHLEVGGVERELARIKKRGSSLLGDRGEPVGEELLTSALHGLSRDSYQTIFSLDDETLERGGEEILASRGNLGRLLFAGTAGIADLSVELDKLREKANKVYAVRSRTHELAMLRQELDRLDRERKESDTQARCFERLKEECRIAEEGYSAARKRAGELRSHHSSLAATKNALPLWHSLLRQEEELAALPPMAELPSEWREEVRELQKRLIAAEERHGSALDDIERCDKELASCSPDPAILALKEKLEEAAFLSIQCQSAKRELPPLKDELREATAEIDALKKRLGSDGDCSIIDFALAEDLLGELEALSLEESELSRSLKIAKEEARAAEEALESARAGVKENIFPDEKMRALSALYESSFDADIEGRLERAEKSLSEKRGAVKKALGKLYCGAVKFCVMSASKPRIISPWEGDYREIGTIAIPTASQAEKWCERSRAIESSFREKMLRLDEAKMRLAQLNGRVKALMEQVGAIADSRAAEVRQRRDEALALLSKSLDSESLKAFEKALAADDAIRDERLKMADRLAKLAVEEVELAEKKATVEAIEEEVKEVEKERGELQREMAPFLCNAGLPENFSPDSLKVWLEELQRLLELAEGEEEALQAALHLQREMDSRHSALFSALQAVGEEPPEPLGVKGLLHLAKERLNLAIREKERSGEAKRALLLKERELKRRGEAYRNAANELALWQKRWDEALRNCKRLSLEGKSLPQIRALLPLLRKIHPLLVREKAASDAIATREMSSELFSKSIGEIAGFLQMNDIGDPFQQHALLQERLQKAEAEEAAQKAAESRRDIARERLETAKGELASIDKRLNAMAGHLPNRGEITSLDHLAVALEQAEKKRRLAEAVREKERHLLAQLGEDSREEAERKMQAVDPPLLEERIAITAAELGSADRELERAIERRRDALRAIEEIGGDSAAALLAEKRKNLLLEIGEKADRALALHLGLMAADRAIALYRDRHRSELLQRSEETFRAITSGEFRELSTQQGHSNDRLVAIRRDGRSISAEEMSKGTRFQLYLALRLAGYKRFCNSFGPLPFVGDDIMETFDDRRAEAAILQLCEIAKVGQALYFTHHRHLAEIALKACGGDVTIHEIPKKR